MDKIEKFLLLLSKKERKILSKILENVRAGFIQGYDVKPLKGYPGFIRLRKGKIRVVYAKTEEGRFIIVHLAYRKDAYKNF